MPIRPEVDPGGSFATVTITNPYTFDEWRQEITMVLSSIVFAATRAILIDRRVAAAPSPRFVEQMFEFFQSHADSLRPGARVAIVVGDTVGVGMGRMLELKAEMLAPSLRMRVFRDPQTAARWLTRPGTAIVGNDRDE